MRILLISDILLTGDFAIKLRQEGNEVRVFIGDWRNKNNLDNLLEKTDSWENELEWVGKEGLIIFEDAGLGKEQDELRAAGYTVLGGSELGERTETDRAFGQQIFAQQGLRILPVADFTSQHEAIAYIRNNPAAWVLKYANGHLMKHLSFIGTSEDGSDVVAYLENNIRDVVGVDETISLQKRAFGIEFGVARYFNGNDWVGPIEYNLEHTHLFPGEIGPNVDEMGTLAWYDDNEDERLYKEVLAPMKDFLKEAKFHGDYSINCIVNSEGAHPIEATARLGAPIIHIQEQLSMSPWTDFMLAVAKGESHELKWKKGFGVVVSVVTTPFPYPYSPEGRTMLGLPVTISADCGPEELRRIHLEEVGSRDGTNKTLYISGSSGTVLYVSGYGDTVAHARKQAYDTVGKITVPKMFYRNDIGATFEDVQLPQLKAWGFLAHFK